MGFVPGGGEAKLRLKYPHLIQVNIYHGLFQLGQTKLGGLHPIPIGYINKINLRHLAPPEKFNNTIYSLFLATYPPVPLPLVREGGVKVREGLRPSLKSLPPLLDKERGIKGVRLRKISLLY